MDNNIDKNKIIASGFLCNIICIVFGLATIPIIGLFDNYRSYALIFYLYIISLSTVQILLSFLKGQEKLKLFAFGNILNTFMIAVFNLLFLLVFDMGILGYFLAYILSNCITTIYVLLFGKTRVHMTKKYIDYDLLKKMLSYSVVLIPTSFMWWIINSSDRIMISSYIGDSANGIYAISYKLPSLLTMLSSIFNQAWVFSAIKEKDDNMYEEYTNNVFEKLFLLLAFASIGLLGILIPLFKIMVSPEFFEAWKFVPILIIGFIFMTLSTFISTSYNVHKDSKGFLYSSIVGAITNIILNFAFIPFFGVYGAAIATLISYIAVFLYRWYDVKKYIQFKFKLSYLWIMIVIMINTSLIYRNWICVFCSSIISLLIIFVTNRDKIRDVINVIIKKE